MPIKHNQTLLSPFKIAAEVNAALAAAGFIGAQILRESIPLYFSFIESMIGAEGKLVLNIQHFSPREIPKRLVSGAYEEFFNQQIVVKGC